MSDVIQHSAQQAVRIQQLERLARVQHNALRLAQAALQQHQRPQAWPFAVKQNDTAALAAIDAALNLHDHPHTST